MASKGYFQPQQAREVAVAFVKHKVEYMFIGKSGAILLGYPSTTQDVDLFPQKTIENCERLILALKDIGFELTEDTEQKILKGVDFVQINQDPFDLDLVFAPDGMKALRKRKRECTKFLSFRLLILTTLLLAKKLPGGKRI